jgi:thiamine kinase-like enzyme
VRTMAATEMTVDLDGVPVRVPWLEEETLAYVRRGRLGRAAECLPHCDHDRLLALLRGEQAAGVMSRVLPFPTVVYRWLPGESLGPSLTAQQLAALLESYHRMHALCRRDHAGSDLPDAWFHWFDFAPYLAELNGLLAEYGPWLAATAPDGRNLHDRLARLVSLCAEAFTQAAVDPGRGRFPLRLCHVDPNLANAVWGENGRLRWVDWEYSGWGDPALDVAELRWHAALAGLSEAQHAWLRDNYRRPDDDRGFGERIALWDRLLATRWPFLVLRSLWGEHNGPDRVRLTRPAADRAELRARLVRFIERAEHMANGA